MNNYKYKEYLTNVVPCIYYGVICGCLTGIGIFFFKLLAKKADVLSRSIYTAAKGSPLYVILVFAALAFMGFVMAYIHKKIPEVKGGGIPRSEGVLRGILSFRWFKTLLGTFLGSMISFICGLPLGSEGPAVLMGTSIGRMCGSVSKNKTTWNRYVMTGGAGAGFAVATGSPLSAILFALEEIHKRFTPMLVLIVSISVLSANYVNRLLCSFFGISPELFDFENFAAFDLEHVGYLLIAGILIAFAVGIFDSSIDHFGFLVAKAKKYLNGYTKVISVFLITGILGFVFADAVYSGHDVIHHAIHNDRSWVYLIILVAIRMILMLLATDSGVTGGIFIPTLAIGVLFGAIISKLLILIGMPAELFAPTVLLSMCAFIGGTLRAPLTATVLFIELTGQFQNLFYIALVVFTVNAITALLNQTPFYDRALENMEHEQNKGKKPIIACFEMKVSHNSFVVGKTVRDIMWPSSSVVMSVKRADEKQQDMDHDGEKKLYAEDTVVLRSRFFDEKEIRQMLADLVGNDHTITRIDV